MRPWIGCDFDGCDRPHRARGFCNGHLEQQRRGREMSPLRTLLGVDPATLAIPLYPGDAYVDREA